MSDQKEMSFLDHLGELRGHLIRSVIAIIIAAVFIGINTNWVVDNILFYPTKPDFPTFRYINYFTQEYLGEESISLPETFPIQVRKLYEQFNVMMSISIFGGILLAFPYIIWELWRFISPALLPNERKYSLIILPFAINFGYFFRISDEIRLSYDLSDYLSIFLQVVFGMAIIFLFPMIVYVLTSLGILTPQLMKTYRRHAIVIIMIIAAIITPADVVSMFIAAIPLLLLYEMSIAMAQIIHKRLLKEQNLD